MSSITAAFPPPRALGLTPSTVSRQIAHLEDHFGVRLLQRSTRKMSLTDEGRSLYGHCAGIAREVFEVEQLAQSLSGHPKGTLRIATTVAFGKAQLLPALPAFLDSYPDLRVTVKLTDPPVDSTESGHDVATRFADQIEDASLVACKLASNDRVVCAAPSYLERHGAPQSPADLADHNCLRVSTVDNWNEWHFGDERTDIFAVYPDRHNLSPKVRAFVDHLVRHFRPVPPWERRKPVRRDH